jgi:hypothetical protein
MLQKLKENLVNNPAALQEEWEENVYVWELSPCLIDPLGGLAP